MIGYVLWSDVAVGKAIIWCEDQGDLAYYSRQSDVSQPTVCKGDWVQFDVTDDGSMRLAANAKVLDEQGYPDLSDMLVEAAPLSHKEAAESSASAEAQPVRNAPVRNGNVIPFPDPHNRRSTVRYG